MAITINGTTGIAGVDGSASTPAVQGTDTNTGIYFGSDTISFAEGGAEVVRIDSSANLRFNSGYGSAAVAYGCRAWVNFNGTGVIAIRGSGNVSSITDNGTGNYTMNFSTAMSDANYCGQLTVDNNLSDSPWIQTLAVGSCTLNLFNSGARIDATIVMASIFR